MRSIQSDRPILKAVAAILAISLASAVCQAREQDRQDNNEQQKGWYKKDHKDWDKKDKDREHGKPGSHKPPVSVPEPGTMALLVTGLIAAMGLRRKRPTV